MRRTQMPGLARSARGRIGVRAKEGGVGALSLCLAVSVYLPSCQSVCLTHALATQRKMTPAGLEPAIPGSVGRCLIHWATGPAAMHRDWRHGNMRRLVGGESKATTVLGLPQPSAHGCQVHEKLNSMIRGSIVASISACHAEDPGSIPGRGGACRLCDACQRIIRSP